MSGHVTAGTSGPAESVTVTLHGNDGVQHGSAITDATGAYIFENVVPGDYQLHFAPPDSAPYAPVWLDDVPFRTSSFYVTLASTSLTDLDATLPEEGSISGTVTYDVSVPSGNQTARATAFLVHPVSGVLQAAGDSVEVAEDGSYRIGHLNAGDYVVRFDGAALHDLYPTYWDSNNFAYGGDAVTVMAGQETDSIDQDGLSSAEIDGYRLSGSDRFATAVEVSKVWNTDPGVDVLWIANGLGFPDALSAGPAAALDGASLLLVTRDSIPAVVLEEIQRLHPGHINVAGGTGVVSSAVFDQLAALATTGASRFGGTDRYETSRLIVQAFFGGYINPVAALADGRNFPDALAAGPAVSPEWGPVILVNGAASAPDAPTRQLLADLETVSVTLAGGTGAISAAMEHSLRATAGIVEVVRDSGTDRYATANALNRRAFPVSDVVFLATGAGFADALAGGALAATVGIPLFLVQKECVPPDVMETIAFLRPKEIDLLGGTGVLGHGIEQLAICGGGFGTGLMMRSESNMESRSAPDSGSTDVLHQFFSARTR